MDKEHWISTALECQQYFNAQLASHSSRSASFSGLSTPPPIEIGHDFAHGSMFWKELESASLSTSSKSYSSHSSQPHPCVHVYKRKGGVVDDDNSDDLLRSKVPMYMGKGIVHDVHPEQVLKLIRRSDLWDPWYKEGWIAVKVDPNTTISYKAMKAVSRKLASERDLSLLENRRETPHLPGGIDYISISVNSVHIPRHPGRVRASLLLGAWRLEPVFHSSTVSTKVTYILQTDIKGSVPSSLGQRYLTKRASIGVAGLIKFFNKKNANGILSDDVKKDPLIRPICSIQNQESAPLSPPASPKRINLLDENPILNPFFDDQKMTPPSSERDFAESSNLLDYSMASLLSTPDISFDQPLPKPPSGYSQQVPLSTISKKALSYMKEVMSDNSEWIFQYEERGVKISFLEDAVGNAKIPIVRGDFNWKYDKKSQSNVEHWLNTILSYDARKIWDPRCEDGRVMRYLSLNEWDFQMYQKGIFPVSGREIVGRQSLFFDSNEQATYLIATSLPDSLSESTGYVRANLLLSGWKFYQQGDEIQVSYIVHIDPKGAIPSRLIRMISRETPLSIANVHEFIVNHGFPTEMMVKCPGCLSSKDFSTMCCRKVNSSFSIDGNVKCIYDIHSNENTPERKSLHSGWVEFGISQIMYPAGVNIQMTIVDQESGTLMPAEDVLVVSLSSDESTIRCVLKKELTRSYRVCINFIKRSKECEKLVVFNDSPIAIDHVDLLDTSGADQVVPLGPSISKCESKETIPAESNMSAPSFPKHLYSSELDRMTEALSQVMSMNGWEDLPGKKGISLSQMPMTKDFAFPFVTKASFKVEGQIDKSFAMEAFQCITSCRSSWDPLVRNQRFIKGLTLADDIVEIIGRSWSLLSHPTCQVMNRIFHDERCQRMVLVSAKFQESKVVDPDAFDAWIVSYQETIKVSHIHLSRKAAHLTKTCHILSSSLFGLHSYLKGRNNMPTSLLLSTLPETIAKGRILKQEWENQRSFECQVEISLNQSNAQSFILAVMPINSYDEYDLKLLLRKRARNSPVWMVMSHVSVIDVVWCPMEHQVSFVFVSGCEASDYELSIKAQRKPSTNNACIQLNGLELGKMCELKSLQPKEPSSLKSKLSSTSDTVIYEPHVQITSSSNIPHEAKKRNPRAAPVIVEASSFPGTKKSQCSSDHQSLFFIIVLWICSFWFVLQGLLHTFGGAVSRFILPGAVTLILIILMYHMFESFSLSLIEI